MRNYKPPIRDPAEMEYLLVSLPNGLCFTFIGRHREVDADTVELCTPDERPILSIPRAYITQSSKDETARRLLEDARHCAMGGN